MVMKICIKCGIEKGVECFSKEKHTKDRLKGQCKTCTAEYQKKYYEEHPDKITGYMKKRREENPEKEAVRQKTWRDENPEKRAEGQKTWRGDNPEKLRQYSQHRRAKKESLTSDFTVEQWEDCLLYFDYKDAYTGLPMDIPSQDHVIPLSKGGSYTATNIVPCDKSTNSSKGNRDAIGWFRKQAYYNVERENMILAYLL